MKRLTLLALTLGLAACGSATAATPAPTTTTTTTTVTGSDQVQKIIEDCKVPNDSVKGGQIILDLSTSNLFALTKENRDALGAAVECITNVISPAGLAVLDTATALVGPQSVTEDGVTYTHISNKADDSNLITVQAAK